jgi:Eukaryotic initiation factor 4E
LCYLFLPTTTITDFTLPFPWVLYEQCEGKKYTEAVKQVCSIESGSKFVGLLSIFPFPSKLIHKRILNNHEKSYVNSLAFFRSPIKPEWEDPVHKNGFALQLNFRPQQFSGDLIDLCFLNLLCALVGNRINEAATGLRILDKNNKTNKVPAIRLEVWFSGKVNTAEFIEAMKLETNKLASEGMAVSKQLPKIEVKFHC